MSNKTDIRDLFIFKNMVYLTTFTKIYYTYIKRNRKTGMKKFNKKTFVLIIYFLITQILLFKSNANKNISKKKIYIRIKNIFLKYYQLNFF